jgi:hypothetical protein
MPVEAPIWNAVSACSRRPGTTRAWASVCLLGIRPQKRMRARSLAIAAWLLSEPYGGARDHIGLLVPLGPACFLTGQAGLPLLGVAGGPSSESMRAGVHYGLTRAGLEFSSSRGCHARCWTPTGVSSLTSRPLAEGGFLLCSLRAIGIRGSLAHRPCASLTLRHHPGFPR